MDCVLDLPMLVRLLESGNTAQAQLHAWSAGVGYGKATRMVDTYGTSMLAIMDSPDCVQKLSQVPTIGHTSAVNFKKHWDASRGIITSASSHTNVFTFQHGVTSEPWEVLLAPSRSFDHCQVEGRLVMLWAI